MPHKMITDRQDVDEALVAAIHRHRNSVLADLAGRLALPDVPSLNRPGRSVIAPARAFFLAVRSDSRASEL